MQKGKLFNKWIKCGIHILFLSSVYLTIRWSDLPAPDNRLFQILFVHTEKVDSAALNTVTGYITGYLVYVLTVLLPDNKRKRPIKKIAMEKLAVLCNKSMYLLLLICKNCCKNESEWDEVLKSKDVDCFNVNFFEYMKRFDMKSEADTLLLHKDTRVCLTWGEYLYEKYDDMYKTLDNLFKEYHYYLDEKDVEIINTLKHSKYLDAFTGKGESLMLFIQGDADKFGYYEDVPAVMFYGQESNLTPIFADNSGTENISILRDYIKILGQLYEYLEKYKRKRGLDIFHEDYAVEKLKRKNVGHLGRAIFIQK